MIDATLSGVFYDGLLVDSQDGDRVNVWVGDEWASLRDGERVIVDRLYMSRISMSYRVVFRNARGEVDMGALEFVDIFVDLKRLK